MEYHAVYWGAEQDAKVKRYIVPIKKTIGEIAEHLRFWIKRKKHLLGSDVQIVVYYGKNKVRCHGLYGWDFKKDKMVLIEHYYDRKANLCGTHEELLFFHPFAGTS